MKTTSTSGGVTAETLSTSTLVEVGADKVVVEYGMTTVTNGMEVKAPAFKRDIPKMIAKAKPPNKDDPKVVEVASEARGPRRSRVVTVSNSRDENAEKKHGGSGRDEIRVEGVAIR